MKIAMTGCTGGLGKKIAMQLMDAGHDVKGLVRAGSVNKVQELLDGYPVDANAKGVFSIVKGDLNDEDAIKEFIEESDFCIHIAAQVTSAPEIRYYQVNVEGTRNICRSIIDLGNTCKLIYCSSIVTLRKEFIQAEGEAKKAARRGFTQYTNSKIDAEIVVDQFVENKNLQAKIVYPGLIYGPGGDNVNNILQSTVKKEFTWFCKEGFLSAPFVYIEDLVNLFTFVFDNFTTLKEYRFVSVKDGEVSLKEVYESVAACLGISLDISKLKLYEKAEIMSEFIALEDKLNEAEAKDEIFKRIGAFSNIAETSIDAFFDSTIAKGIQFDFNSIKGAVDLRSLHFAAIDTGNVCTIDQLENEGFEAIGNSRKYFIGAESDFYKKYKQG